MADVTKRLAASFRSGVRLISKPAPPPEPVYCEPRAATGLFASLSHDKKEAVLSYRGPQDHGDMAFSRK